MTIWWLALILGFIFTAGISFIYLAIKLSRSGAAQKTAQDFEADAEKDVEHIFNDEFREELRNRGRLHFEKILGENAMFLQQDLRLTTSQLNDYMKDQISHDLKEAFANYESAISDAKQLAVESIEKTKEAIDDQRSALSSQLEKEVSDEKGRRIKRFDENMADVVNHYVLAAIGNQIDLNDQLDYILGELEANKSAILEDVVNGA
jgi:vacuolar-type H+-ATPase subunit H